MSDRPVLMVEDGVAVIPDDGGLYDLGFVCPRCGAVLTYFMTVSSGSFTSSQRTRLGCRSCHESSVVGPFAAGSETELRSRALLPAP